MIGQPEVKLNALLHMILIGISVSYSFLTPHWPHVKHQMHIHYCDAVPLSSDKYDPIEMSVPQGTQQIEAQLKFFQAQTEETFISCAE